MISKKPARQLECLFLGGPLHEQTVMVRPDSDYYHTVVPEERQDPRCPIVQYREVVYRRVTYQWAPGWQPSNAIVKTLPDSDHAVLLDEVFVCE